MCGASERRAERAPRASERGAASEVSEHLCSGSLLGSLLRLASKQARFGAGPLLRDSFGARGICGRGVRLSSRAEGTHADARARKSSEDEGGRVATEEAKQIWYCVCGKACRSALDRQFHWEDAEYDPHCHGMPPDERQRVGREVGEEHPEHDGVQWHAKEVVDGGAGCATDRAELAPCER